MGRVADLRQAGDALALLQEEIGRLLPRFAALAQEIVSV
jgi:hypothetical protein